MTLPLRRIWIKKRDWHYLFWLSQSLPGVLHGTCALACLGPGGQRAWVWLGAWSRSLLGELPGIDAGTQEADQDEGARVQLAVTQSGDTRP